MSDVSLPGDKYVCPACGFRVLTRSYPKCERCGKPLPIEWVRTKDEISQEWSASQARAKSLNLPADSDLGDVGGDIW